MATLIKKLLNLVGPDTLQIFGDTGSGKTTFALEVTVSAGYFLSFFLPPKFLEISIKIR